MANRWKEVSVEEARRHPLYGAGGWLLAFAVGLALTMLTDLGKIQLVAQQVGLPFWELLSLKDPAISYTKSALFINFIRVTVIYWLLFSKHPRFRWGATACMLTFWPACALAGLIFAAPGAGSLMVEIGIKWLISCVVWVTYLHRSKRVRVTYEHCIKVQGPAMNHASPKPCAGEVREEPDRVPATVIPGGPVADTESSSPAVEFWAAALEEFESANRHPGLWARTFSEANGQESVAKASYLSQRAREIQIAHTTTVADEKAWADRGPEDEASSQVAEGEVQASTIPSPSHDSERSISTSQPSKRAESDVIYSLILFSAFVALVIGSSMFAVYDSFHEKTENFPTPVTVPVAEPIARAWLDRDVIDIGETVTFNIELTGSDRPDFSVLESDFLIGGYNSSNQVKFDNGREIHSTLWTVVVEPLRSGSIRIPAFTLSSGDTETLTLVVWPVPTRTQAPDDVFVEVVVDAATPYVQQQVGYTVRLFYAVALQSGDLSDPSGDGMQVQRIGQDVQYTRGVQGRAYNVVERRYALTPERSGALEVGGVTFRGRLARGGQAGGFFSQGTPASVGSEAITLKVRPVPSTASSPWLPARDFTLRDNAERLRREIKVGNILELTVVAEAHGLFAEQLPELTLPSIPGAKIYPREEIHEFIAHDDNTIGRRIRKFDIVPMREGALEIPEHAIFWWNVESNKSERAAVPARIFFVHD